MRARFPKIEVATPSEPRKVTVPALYLPLISFLVYDFLTFPFR